MARALDPALDRDNRQLRADDVNSLVAARRHDRSNDKGDRRNARAGNGQAMNRCGRSWKRVLAGAALSLLAFDRAAVAADLPVKAPRLQAVVDWTGLYIGAHAGYSRGGSSAV